MYKSVLTTLNAGISKMCVKYPSFILYSRANLMFLSIHDLKIYSYFERVVLNSLFFKEVWKNDTREHGRTFESAKGKQQKQVRQLQSQEQCIDHIPYYLSALLFACTFFSDNLSRNSCIYNQNKYCFPPSKANWNYSLIIKNLIKLHYYPSRDA